LVLSTAFPSRSRSRSTGGTPTTAGLTHRAGHRAASDASVLARLREAGAIVLGKTNVSQLLLHDSCGIEADADFLSDAGRKKKRRGSMLGINIQEPKGRARISIGP
jgi:hypothetical protein